MLNLKFHSFLKSTSENMIFSMKNLLHSGLFVKTNASLHNTCMMMVFLHITITFSEGIYIFIILQ